MKYVQNNTAIFQFLEIIFMYPFHRKYEVCFSSTIYLIPHSFIHIYYILVFSRFSEFNLRKKYNKINKHMKMFFKQLLKRARASKLLFWNATEKESKKCQSGYHKKHFLLPKDCYYGDTFWSPGRESFSCPYSAPARHV